MNVCVIRLSMAVTVTRARGARFSETALSGRPHPGHRPARGDAQRRAAVQIAAAVGGRRLAHDGTERPAEGPEAVEADREADLRHRLVALAGHLHFALDPAAPQGAGRGRRADRPGTGG